LPTSAGQEDHNANATTSARRLAQVVNNVRNILAIELLIAAQAVELRLSSQPNLRLGNGTEHIYKAVRHQVPLIDHDQTMTTYVETLTQMIARGEFSGLVEPQMAGNP
jgi:histidine ammonia-lyase